GIGLRAYGQRDPLNEYKREAFEMFEAMLDRLRETVTGVLCHIEIRRPEEAIPERRPQAMQESRRDPALAHAEPELAMAGAGGGVAPRPVARQAAGPAMAAAGPGAGGGNPWGKTPRNAPCPCGSGKKYKHCHGRL